MNIDSYEINSSTIAIIPKSNKQSLVYEENESFLVEMSTLNIIKKSCEYFGSSLEGRRIGTINLVGFTHKVPIIIEESFNIIFFPTKSAKSSDCCWISYNHVSRPIKLNDKTLIELKNGKKIIIDSSLNTLESQLYRSSRLYDMLNYRKLAQNGKKATKR